MIARGDAMTTPPPGLPRKLLPWLRIVSWLRVVVMCALVALTARPVHADPAPPPHAVPVDVATEGGELALPEVPKDFTQRTVGRVHWAYPKHAEHKVRPLMEAHEKLWRAITRELGAEVDPSLHVRVASGPDQLRRLAPVKAPPPRYATGVAYPQLGFVLLSEVTPDTWLPPDLSAVYAHELSHIALHRAVGGAPLPRWFSEGLAIHQAKEQTLARIQTLWEATVRGTLHPLRDLSRRFPTRPHEVNVAYAQSGDFVRHMLAAPDDRGRFRRVIRDVAAGRAFDDAVKDAYYVPPEFLEREWRAELETRFTSMPLLLTGTAVWGLLGLLLVWAFISKRRRDKRTLARWAEQEAEAEAQRPPQVVVLATQRADPPDSGDTEEAQWSSTHPPPSVRHHTPPSGVPTIEHDGRQHTLH